MRKKTTLLNVTPLAWQKIAEMIDKRGKPTLGIRIGIRTKGCSGMSYVLEYNDQLNAADEVISNNNTNIYIDPKSILFLIGSTMDFKEEEFSSGFTFTNPNERGRCGCGSSFHV